MTSNLELRTGVNAQEGIENLKFALAEEKIDAKFVQNNLDSLNQEIASVGGDLSRLGIKLDDLKHLEQKLIGKAGRLGAEFPVKQVEALTQTIEKMDQIETTNKEKGVADTGSETPYSPETMAKGDRANIDSTVAAYSAWRRLYKDSDLADAGPMWTKIDTQLTDHIEKLKALKGLDIVQKGKLPDDVEDNMLATIKNAQDLKKWHDNLPSRPTKIAA